jgi:hypothetical protein
VADFRVAGANIIRLVVWDILRADLNWQAFDNGLIPIITPDQQPEFNNQSNPYIVYNYMGQASSDTSYWIDEEQATFTVYSQSEEDVRKVVNLFKDNFKAYDESARMVNEWLAYSSSSSNEFRKFDFKWIRLVSTMGANPVTEEGGRTSGSATIRYRYTYTDPLVTTAGGRANFGRFHP